MAMTRRLAIFWAVLAVVLPRFESLFAESQVPLPLATRAVLALGHFVGTYGWICAVGLALGIAGLARGLIKVACGRMVINRRCGCKRARLGWFAGNNCNMRTSPAMTQPLPRLQKIFLPLASRRSK